MSIRMRHRWGSVLFCTQLIQEKGAQRLFGDLDPQPHWTIFAREVTSGLVPVLTDLGLFLMS